MPILRRVQGYISFLLENSLILVVGASLGLIWANTAQESYENLTNHIRFAVNEIGMVFFFAIAAKEVFESILPGGALSSRRKAAMPLLATVGGMVGPALIFIAGCHFLSRPELRSGWAIPCATDIAFSYLIARIVFGAKHPAIPFLLLLAIADDGIGLLILALFYNNGQGSLILFIVLVVAAIAISLLMKRFKVESFWPYIIISGSLSWIGFEFGGFHPALAMVPVIFAMPHGASDEGIFVEEEANQKHTDALNKFERWWQTPVEIILGLFGFVNAGVIFNSVGAGTWLVLVALVLGKPIGIMAFSLIGRIFGLRLPEGVTWSHLTLIGCAAAVGFTVSLFISTVAFPHGKILETMKMGALLSLGAMFLTYIVGKLLKVQPVKG